MIYKQKVINHFWPEVPKAFLIFNFDKYGFLTYKEEVVYNDMDSKND